MVALNVQPKNALLSDSNFLIIRLYQEVQSGALTPALAKSFLTDEGSKLRKDGKLIIMQFGSVSTPARIPWIFSF